MSDKPQTRRFLKELVSRTLRSSKGWPILFEDIGDDTGILETTDPFTIRELEAAMLARKGGVHEVLSDEEWTEAKKKATEREQYRQRVKPLSEQLVRLEPKKRAASPATGSAPPPDPSLPTPPPVGKVLEVPTDLPAAPKRIQGRRPKAVTGDGTQKEGAEKPVEVPA